MSTDDRRNLVIVGAGGHGSELYSYIQDMVEQGEKITFMGFVDEQKPSGPLGATEILGGFDQLQTLLARDVNRVIHYITAVGTNQLRDTIVQNLERQGKRNLSAWTLRHPRSIVGQNVQIGEGTCLAPGSIVTTNANMGKHCILNVNASVSHDCRIGDFTNINPGAVIAGNVRIGEGCYIGAGATIIDKVSIGDWAIIGAGSVVIKDIPPRVTAVGVPARIIKHHA